MEGKRCLVKKKTRTARRTLEPLYQQQLEFKVEFTGKTLQVNNELAFFYSQFFSRVIKGRFCRSTGLGSNLVYLMRNENRNMANLSLA